MIYLKSCIILLLAGIVCLSLSGAPGDKKAVSQGEITAFYPVPKEYCGLFIPGETPAHILHINNPTGKTLSLTAKVRVTSLEGKITEEYQKEFTLPPPHFKSTHIPFQSTGKIRLLSDGCSCFFKRQRNNPPSECLCPCAENQRKTGSLFRYEPLPLEQSSARFDPFRIRHTGTAGIPSRLFDPVPLDLRQALQYAPFKRRIFELF